MSDLFWLTDAQMARLDPFFPESPQLNWSTAIFRKWRTKNGKQATEARRDCLEVTAG